MRSLYFLYRKTCFETYVHGCFPPYETHSHVFFARPPTPLCHARTHFREKWGIFSMGGANSRNQENGVILQAWVREILKRGKFLHVFITICLFRMFELLCINVFEL